MTAARLHRPRPDPLPLGDAGRCRRAGVLENLLKGAGFDGASRHLRRARHRRIDNLYARIGDQRAAPHLRRPYRRGAAGRRGRMDPWRVRRRDQGRRALRPRRRRHEGRHRLQRRGGAAIISRDHGGKPKGSISFLITGDEEGIAVNGTIKLLQWAAARGEKFDHCVLGEPTNVEALGDMHQDRPARLAVRHAVCRRHAGPRRLSAPRRQSGAGYFAR